MAKAQFHKNQRVYVRPVGTWATIERIVPQWVKDMDEPLRIHYDVGLGRDFAARELETEEVATLSHLDPEMEEWHVVRVANKWRGADECANHPIPGTHPVVVRRRRSRAIFCRHGHLGPGMQDRYSHSRGACAPFLSILAGQSRRRFTLLQQDILPFLFSLGRKTSTLHCRSGCMAWVARGSGGSWTYRQAPWR